jgi:hypothetical protein
VYDGFVESLNFEEVGIELDEGQVGNSEGNAQAVGIRVLLRGKGLKKTGAGVLSQFEFHVADGGIKTGPQDDCGVSAAA